MTSSFIAELRCLGRVRSSPTRLTRDGTAEPVAGQPAPAGLGRIVTANTIPHETIPHETNGVDVGDVLAAGLASMPSRATTPGAARSVRVSARVLPFRRP